MGPTICEVHLRIFATQSMSEDPYRMSNKLPGDVEATMHFEQQESKTVVLKF